MIFKTASPISPDVLIAIDNVNVDYMALQRISIEQRENHHDLLTLDFSGFNPELFTSYLEKPVTVTISYPNLESCDFYGYITFIEPTAVTNQGLVDGSPFQMVRVYCLGASYLMKSKTSKVWENVRSADMSISRPRSAPIVAIRVRWPVVARPVGLAAADPSGARSAGGVARWTLAISSRLGRFDGSEPA